MADQEERPNPIIEAKQRLDLLRALSLQFCAKLPLIEKQYQQRDRANSRYLGHPRFDSRRHLLNERRSLMIDPFYWNFRALYEEVVDVIEKLHFLLPSYGFHNLLDQIRPAAIPQVQATDQALQSAIAKLEPLYDAAVQFVGDSSANHQPDATRESRLQEFKKQMRTTFKAIMQAANVHKPQMTQWRKDRLPDHSIISGRIEDVLAGKRPLKPNASL